VQPDGAVSHTNGVEALHRPSPNWHWLLHGGTHSPLAGLQRSPPGTLQGSSATQPGQPVAVLARQTSTPPVDAPQRLAPTVHELAHVTQSPPPWQNSSTRQGVMALHTVQLLASVTHVSKPRPLHRLAPSVQVVPQTPHAPPEQNVLQVWVCCQAVHPWALAVQVCTALPMQRVVPAVHAEVQLPQRPLAQVVPAGQTEATHCAQPVTMLPSQVSTPVAVQLVQLAHELHTPLAHSSP
jgi:hypothetical protein